jgi:hypothetical protein
MKKTIKKIIELPFEEGKTYKTKFATGERFLVKKIIWGKIKVEGKTVDKIFTFEGIYEKHPHLGVCPLSADRLCPDTIEGEEYDICHKCGEPI